MVAHRQSATSKRPSDGQPSQESVSQCLVDLHYNYFRDYEPAIGRYVQSDPIGLTGGTSTFGYVIGNPLVNTDPEGKLYSRIAGDVRSPMTVTSSRALTLTGIALANPAGASRRTAPYVMVQRHLRQASSSALGTGAAYLTPRRRCVDQSAVMPSAES
ncbi:MAG: RHS repeat-associated core domain-containing protein [Betaproteobacteria bacterium]|nr:RHS repeat-associated core domain-containing protein [Betaproteobacteria bacterium]